MTKKLLALLCVLMLGVCLFAACGKDAEPTKTKIEVGADVSVEMVDSVFEDGTKVTAEAVTSGTVYERAKAAVADVAEQFTVFDINAVKEEAKVQPSGKLAVSFPIPQDFSTNVTVYYVADDGSKEKLNTVVDETARTATAELSHFSVYVLVQLREEPSEEGSTTVTTTTTTTEEPIVTPATTTKVYAKAATKRWQLLKQETHELEMWTLDLPGLSIGYMAGHYDEAMPEEYIRENPDDFYLYQGQYYMWGRGDGCPVESVIEEGNTVTVVAEGNAKLVLKRTSEKKMTVVSDATGMELRAGDVFTMK